MGASLVACFKPAHLSHSKENLSPPSQPPSYFPHPRSIRGRLPVATSGGAGCGARDASRIWDDAARDDLARA